MERNHSLEFKIISKHRMISFYLPKLKICLEHLGNELIWTKESEDLNNIGGIVLHLKEHVDRNTKRLREVNITFDTGIENYFPNINKDKQPLIEGLERSFLDFGLALDNSSQFDLYNIYHLVEHTGYHLGQIIDRALRMGGIKFQFVQNGINERELKRLVDEEIEKDH
jgi:hypothetical protein